MKRCSGDSTTRPAANGTIRRRKRLRTNSETVCERRPNHASAPAIRNIAGMPQGKQNAAKTLRATLRWAFETSHGA